MGVEKGQMLPANLKNGQNLQREHHLHLARLPDCMGSVNRVARKFRDTLNACVTERKGSISVVDASLIHQATSHQVHHLVCGWLLRRRYDEMSATDIKTCSESMAQATDRRTKALRELGLDVQESNDIIATLYSAVEPTERDDDE